MITGLGYWFIGVELALALAVVAFAGEIVPILGPWIAFFILFPVIPATQPDRAGGSRGLASHSPDHRSALHCAARRSPVEMTPQRVRFCCWRSAEAWAGGIGVIFAVPVAAILR
ncbi:MAG: hypothetical protein R2845_00670 [Thermomicrobiales bacterium]